MASSYIWVERKFQFELPVWMFANTLSRVRGGPARVEDILRDCNSSILTKQQKNSQGGDSWSIQEHIGHLVDLEPLWATRLSELIEGASHLTAWEETNQATYDAEHNLSSLDSILEEFRAKRFDLVERLDGIDESLIERTALHPRLQTPMRLIDLVYFVAEHDDHHLAEVARLKKEIKTENLARKQLGFEVA